MPDLTKRTGLTSICPMISLFGIVFLPVGVSDPLLGYLEWQVAEIGGILEEFVGVNF